MSTLSFRANDRLFIIAASAAMILLFYYFSLDKASNALNAIGVSILAATSLFVLKSKGGWVFLLYAFGLTFALLSGALIEATGAYLIEVQETAQLTGAAARNALLAAFFLLATYAAHKLFLRIIPNRLPKIHVAENIATKILLVIAFAAPLYIAAVLMIYGSPLFMGMDRFKYFTDVAPAGYLWFYGNIPLLGFVVALAAYKGFIRHRTSLAWLTLTIFIYVMAGEKFSGIFLLGFFFLLPFFIIVNPAIKARHIFIGSIAIIVMVAVVLLNYTLIYGSADIFMARLTLQGQMNYALDQISSAAQPLTSIIRNFLGFGAPENDTGLVRLMYLVAPAVTVDRMVEYGANFTVPFPANIEYFFGFHLAPFAILSLSIMTGASCALLLKSVMRSNMILSVVSAKLFIFVYTSIVMGEIYLLLEAKTVLLVSLVSLYFLVLAIQRPDNRLTS
jgi:hypothetical protein